MTQTKRAVAYYTSPHSSDRLWRIGVLSLLQTVSAAHRRRAGEAFELAVVKIFSKSSSSSGIERRMVELTVQNKRWRLLIPP
jgi:hypothetical protein